MKKNREIVSQQVSLTDWYTSIVEKAELIHYSSIKGFMSFLPRGWAIWELIQQHLNYKFKQLGIKNVAMPSLFPYSDLLLESKHVEGFKPELFLVTNKGDDVLTDPYVLRPTSEVAFCKLWSETLQNYNQLPMLYNQWCSVFRVEKNTRPFLRNSEFHWQEMHGAFGDEKTCQQMVVALHETYAWLINEVLMIPTLTGLKSPNERFAGALQTYTLETIMPDGQALQSATSHHLGQNFAKAFDIKFQTKENKYEHVHTMSAGMSTRIIGGLIMSHGDDNGLVLPFNIAPDQIVIATLPNTDATVNEAINQIKMTLAQKYRVSVDNSNASLGSKLSKQEVYGTPLTIVIGPKDLAENKVVLKWRNSFEKVSVSLNDLLTTIASGSQAYDRQLYDKVKQRYEQQIVQVKNYDEFKAALNDKKIILAPWAGNENDEVKLKQETGATARCIYQNIHQENLKCFFTNQPAKFLIYFGRSY